MSKKLIHITEERLVEIVRESIQNYMLLEYAVDRNTFMTRVYHLSRQIVIHWCLIKHGRLTHNDNNIIHWKKELRGWMSAICEMELKKNNSADTRNKAITKVWHDLDYISRLDMIKKVITCKFRDEGFNMLTEEVSQTCEAFSNETQILINLMSNADINEVYDYVENL